MTAAPSPEVLSPEAREFYCRVIATLTEQNIPFLVGGAYAYARYTGIERHTKDFDIFVRERDRDAVLAALEGIDCRTEIPFPHWIAKGYMGEDFVDVIYSSGNGVAAVDDEWFDNAVDGTVFDQPVKLCAAEEIIWSKGYVQERERFDGADILHLIRATGRDLDWKRLIRRYAPDWRVLLGHLIMFGFVYPRERDTVPPWVMRGLMTRLGREIDAPARGDDAKLCYGTLVSRQQYLTDIEEWGYTDARLLPRVHMDESDIDLWTAGIQNDGTH